MKRLCQDLRRVHIDIPHWQVKRSAFHAHGWVKPRTLYRAERVPGAANLAVTSGQHRQVAEARQTICRWSKRIHPAVKCLFVYRSCHILKWDNIMVNMFPYIKTKTLRYWQWKQATFTLHSLFVSSVYALYDIYFYIQVLRFRNLFDCRWKLYLFGFDIKVRLFPPTFFYWMYLSGLW